MQLLKPKVYFKTATPNVMNLLEDCGRVCYKSEEAHIKEYEKLKNDPEIDLTDLEIHRSITDNFINRIIKRGHLSVIEHAYATARFICDRGVLAEMTRHRLSSFSAQSTRYVRSGSSSFILPKKKLTEEEIIYYYEKGFTIKKISEATEGALSEHNVWNVLNNYNIKRRGHNQSKINYDFFETINTPEKAYLLGIIQSDGNLRRGSNQITITQHEDNSWYLLCMIRHYISPKANRSIDKNCHNISFSNNTLYNDLRMKGIVPAKSFEMTNQDATTLWNSIPLEFKWDFIRGMLDGDGCVRFFRQSNKTQTFSCNITWLGQQLLLEYMKDFIELELDYKYKCTVSKHGDANVWDMRITKPDIGLWACKKMLKNFKFPFGHPFKTMRMLEYLDNYEISFANWGDKQFEIIVPSWIKGRNRADWLWAEAMDNAEISYRELSAFGWKPEQARSVLPNSTKTEIMMSANMREWMHVFTLRTGKAAHPQIREIMMPLLAYFRQEWPILFNDIGIVDEGIEACEKEN